MPIVQADRLTRIGAALLKAAGASDEEAQAVAVGCVNANLAGHDSHGIIAIPTYIDRVKAGHIVPGAKWTIVQESPTTTVIDGHWGFGFHVNTKAMQAKKLTEAYKIDGVPAIGVHGRFYTAGSLAGDNRRALAVADYLIQVVRKA